MIGMLERLARELRCRRQALVAATDDNSRAKRRIDAAADSLSRGGKRLNAEERERALDDLVKRMRSHGVA